LEERRSLAKKFSFASQMTQSDARDFRAFFPEFCSFSIVSTLSSLEQRAVRRKESTLEVVNRNTEFKRANSLGAREQANQQFELFMPIFRMFYLSALALVAQYEKTLK
jgi:hypothetical protein